MWVFALRIIFLVLSFKNVFSANILITIDLPSPSHQLWHYRLAEGIIAQGHNVTFLGPFSDRGKKSEKYHPLVIEDVLIAVNIEDKRNIEQTLVNMDALNMLKTFTNFFYAVCNHSYHSQGFRTLLNYPKNFKFDLIIIDVTISSCFYPLIQKFNYPPTIGTTPYILPSYLSATFGNGLYPSYIPHYYLRYTENMNFYQRVINFIIYYLEYFLKQTYDMYLFRNLAKNTFGDDVESMQSLEGRISLLLSNIDMVFNQPQPVTPNIIPVGGLHIDSSKPLPKDLQTIMDKAKNGVILFCLGTNVRSDKLGIKNIQALLNAFGQLNEIVIWKFESDLKDAPKNVIIRDWLPQNSILAHPNTKLFISHGGALSTHEAAYYGVPVIGMPFFIDQQITVGHIVDRKLGLRMDPDTVSTEQVLSNVKEILGNPVYSTNMKLVSERMRDKQNTPLETAVFWVEYAIRHNGTSFLNPKSRDMSTFISSSFDVIIFLTLLLGSIIYLSFFIIKICISFRSIKSTGKQKIQ